MEMSTIEEQLKDCWEHPITKDYLVVLRQLIAHRSIFAQQLGLEETAQFLKEIFSAAGAQVIVDQSYAAPFVLATFKSPRPDAKTVIFISTMTRYLLILTKNGLVIPLP